MQGLGLTTILACLQQGEQIMNIRPDDWKAGRNADAEFFTKRQAAWRQSLAMFRDELKAFATLDPNELQAKMDEWKMRIAPPPTFGPGAVYMISQLKELIQWAVEGKDVTRRWPEFKLAGSMTTLYSHRESGDPVVALRTKKAGDQVFVVRWNQPLSGLNAMMQQIEKIEASMTQGHWLNSHTDGVQIPCVSAVTNPDLSWLLTLKNLDWFIAYAAQRIEFGMNKVGFAQREETVMVTMRYVEPRRELPPYILCENGESFLFWRRRQGVDFPVSLYQFTQEDFKDPGDLQKIVE